MQLGFTKYKSLNYRQTNGYSFVHMSIKHTIMLRFLLTVTVVGVLVLSNCQPPEDDRTKIRQLVDTLKLVDTHEHLIPESMRLATTTDFFHLFKDYIQNDLISAGMSPQDIQYMFNPDHPLERRWEKFSPYWQKTRNTSYAQNILIAVKDLFGVEDIDINTYQELNRKVLESNQPGWYYHVLKEKAGIEIALLDPLAYGYPQDSTIQIQREFCVRVKRFPDIIRIDANRLRAIEQRTGRSIDSLADFLKVIDFEFQKIQENPEIVGLKSGHAYTRAIHYTPVTFEQAETVFKKIRISAHETTEEEIRMLQDFVMFYLLENAERQNLPIQIHTGVLAGTGHSMVIENTKATLLTNLFVKFPKLKFVIFHGSYPYMPELGVLAKTHPNVYIDMSWMYVISPEASKKALEEWLLTVPANKIMAFGGDYGQTVESTYAHAKVARKVVTEVLTEMINKEYLTEQEALYIARRILRENALEVYNLSKKDGYYIKG